MFLFLLGWNLKRGTLVGHQGSFGGTIIVIGQRFKKEYPSEQR